MNPTPPIPTPIPTPPSPMPERQFYKNRWLFIGIVILFIAIISVVFIGSKQKSTETPSTNSAIQESTNPQTNIKTTPPLPSQTISVSPVQLVAAALKNDPDLSVFVVANPEPYETDGMIWVSSDNWTISVASPEAVILHLPTTEKDLYNSTVNTTQSQKFQALVASVMQQAGYHLNTLNSSTSTKDDKYYDYIQAYENNAFDCVAITNPDAESYGRSTAMLRSLSVLCAPKTAFEQAYTQQLPFLRAINDHTAILRNIRIKDGNKMQADINWRRTGAELFMYNDGTSWKKISIAQAAGPCSDLEKANIPRQFWIDCYDSANNLVKGSF
ncbi:MAG TPA: hypothetical protein VG935_04795 [Patescibacteria group bacterium]|nr:hypothetical protein [Patescibacteria group bacterium]